jgi:hypothetical protein
MCKDWEASDRSSVTRARTRKRQPNPSWEGVPATGISPGVFDCGVRSGVCVFGNIVPGMFTLVLAKHSKSFSLIDCISVGVDRIRRNFEPMREQVEAWQRSELMDDTAKVIIYEAFLEAKLQASKHLARAVYDLYFLCGAEIYVALASGRG